MGHDGKPCPVGYADHLSDLLGLQGAAGEDAEAVKVHEAGDHDFDKIPALCADLLDQGLVRFHGVEAPADEAAVVAPLVDGEEGGPVGDAVRARQIPGEPPHAPTVPAIPEVGESQGPVGLQPGADQVLPGALPVGGNGVFVIDAVQHHMDVAICVHEPHSLLPDEEDA